MNIRGMLAKAQDYGIDRAWVLNRRREYLTGRIYEANDQLAQMREELDGLDGLCSLGACLSFDTTFSLLEVKRSAYAELETIKAMTFDVKQEVTDDMLQAARDYPIERLVEFRHGKALAWCHPDRRPSLIHLRRVNRAWCPVCDKKWDSIGVIMERQGLNFLGAVKYLAEV